MSYDAESNASLDQTIQKLGFSSGDAAQECSRTKALEFVREAAAYISDQLDRTLDPTALTLQEFKAVTDLAACGIWLHMTGQSNVGWTATIGNIQFSGAPSKVFQVEQMLKWVEDFVIKNKEIEFTVGVSTY